MDKSQEQQGLQRIQDDSFQKKRTGFGSYVQLWLAMWPPRLHRDVEDSSRLEQVIVPALLTNRSGPSRSTTNTLVVETSVRKNRTDFGSHHVLKHFEFANDFGGMSGVLNLVAPSSASSKQNP
jgi:hypothetical protein